MKKITRKVWCHLSINDKERHYVTEIRSSEALEVGSFSELVRHAAYISYYNPSYSLFYRAQSEDYQTSDNQTSLYPSIYRGISETESRKVVLIERVDLIRRAEEDLLHEFGKRRFIGRTKLEKFREMRWAILQHYGVCKTPLLDVTQSLRVACSFALDGARDDPYVFVLGFPHPTGSISYSVEEELLNIKLISICPPRAIRPYFQEGFLVGSFPTSEETRRPQLDVAGRLIAKFRLKRAGFLDENFQPIPHRTLYPPEDMVERVCNRVKQAIGNGSV